MELRDGRVRKLRKAVNEPGQVHELTFSCFQRLPMLNNDRTRRWFIEALRLARANHRLELWAYVIMPEHAHVLLLPEAGHHSTSAILKTIKQSVSRKAVAYLRDNHADWLERLRVDWPTGRREYRFWQQGGGYDRNLVKPEALWRSVEYIHNNPVRRGLADSALDWLWSSAGWYAGVTDVVLEMDGCPPGRPA